MRTVLTMQTKLHMTGSGSRAFIVNDGSDFPPLAVHIGIMACILFLQGIHAVFSCSRQKNIKLKFGQTIAIAAEEKT